MRPSRCIDEPLATVEERMDPLKLALGALLAISELSIEHSRRKNEQNIIIAKRIARQALIDCEAAVAAASADDGDEIERRMTEHAERACTGCGKDHTASDDPTIWTRDDEALHALLSLVTPHGVPMQVIGSWSDAQAKAAEEWATIRRLFGRDNDEKVPSVPEVVKPYLED